jgi:hypothetical protein
MTNARRRAPLTPALVLALVLALSAAACSGDGGSSEPTTTATSQPTPSPSPSPFSQQFDNGEPCPTGAVEGVPEGAGCVTTAEGDLDGDGEADRFLVYATLKPNRKPDGWFVRAELANGGETEPRAIPYGPAAGGVSYVYPRAVGTVDANDDGRDEVLVKLAAIIYHVAGQRIVGMFGLNDGQKIEPVSLPDGSPLVFTTGGIASLGQGATCLPGATPPKFVITRAQKVAPKHWQLTKFTYEWSGEGLIGPRQSVTTLPFSLDFTDPRILEYYGLSCGDIHSVS